MSESYCLKSCADCGKCSGCRSGAYAARCDIAKCCREKNHENCDSCTRGITCPTRSVRDMMPQKIHDQDRREAERLAAKRGNAAVIAKWTRIIFWCTMASIAVGLLGFLENVMPAIRWVELAGTVALMALTVIAYLKMKDVCAGFRTYAILHLVVEGLSLAMVYLQEGPLLTVVELVFSVIGIIAIRVQCLAFRDALSGIDEEMSDKWLRQWNLFKIALLIAVGGLLSCIILSVWGLVIVLGGFCVVLFALIREYVYLYQTAQICLSFSEAEN